MKETYDFKTGNAGKEKHMSQKVKVKIDPKVGAKIHAEILRSKGMYEEAKKVEERANA